MLLNKPKNKIRYAVVGLGYIAQSAVLPAFKNARKNSELKVLVSGNKEKLKKLGEKYNIEKCYLYSEFEQCLKNGEVDAIYVATPNFNHRGMMELAAKYGVHVLCEKPTAVTSDDCRSMIQIADKNNIQLMIAYRLHFEAANLQVIKLVQSKRIGDPKIFNSVFTMQVKDQNNIRLQDQEKGGGLYMISVSIASMLLAISLNRSLLKSSPWPLIVKNLASRKLTRM